MGEGHGRVQGETQGQPTAAQPTGTHATERASSGTLFRPTVRPPIATLTVCDDGRPDGEVIRIRDHKFVIGRTEGDLRIPIDGRISSRHAEITLQSVGGLHRWVVTDLQSTHGMFVRVSRTILADRAEFLVGNGRYRCDAPQSSADATAAQVADAATSGATQGWDGSPSPFRPPAITEMIGYEIGNRVLLVKPEYWIGTDPTCSICRSGDPFCEPRHVRLFRAWWCVVRRAQPHPERPLAAHVADRRGIGRAFPARRAAVRAPLQLTGVHTWDGLLWQWCAS